MATNNKLDKTGLSQVWAKIVANFVPLTRKINGKALDADVTLGAADVSAIPTSEKGAVGGVAGLDAAGKVPTSQLPAGLPASGGNADTVNNHTVESDVPANAKFTDTVYVHPVSGVTTGTYKSVTVDADGHVTAGTNPTTVAGYGIKDVYTKTETDNAIKQAVAGTYRVKGTVAFANLPTADMVDGDVYNISDAFTTTASFKEGAGKEYPAGTNVVYVAADAKWDCMAGTYDFSGYMLKTDLVDITSAEIDEICVMPTV